MHRAAKQTGMLHRSTHRLAYNVHLLDLRLYHRGYHMKHIIQHKRYMLQFNITCLQFAHIQHIIDQKQQMFCGHIYFFQTFIHFCLILTVMTDHLQHSHYTVDRCADIVTHPA